MKEFEKKLPGHGTNYSQNYVIVQYVFMRFTLLAGIVSI